MMDSLSAASGSEATNYGVSVNAAQLETLICRGVEMFSHPHKDTFPKYFINIISHRPRAPGR